MQHMSLALVGFVLASWHAHQRDVAVHACSKIPNFIEKCTPETCPLRRNHQKAELATQAENIPKQSKNITNLEGQT